MASLEQKVQELNNRTATGFMQVGAKLRDLTYGDQAGSAPLSNRHVIIEASTSALLDESNPTTAILYRRLVKAVDNTIRGVSGLTPSVLHANIKTVFPPDMQNGTVGYAVRQFLQRLLLNNEYLHEIAGYSVNWVSGGAGSGVSQEAPGAYFSYSKPVSGFGLFRHNKPAVIQGDPGGAGGLGTNPAGGAHTYEAVGDSLDMYNVHLGLPRITVQYRHTWRYNPNEPLPTGIQSNPQTVTPTAILF